MPSEPRLLTTAELARKLGLTTRTLQRYRREGLIVPQELTIGGHARWIEKDVREQMRKLRQQRHPEKGSSASEQAGGDGE